MKKNIIIGLLIILLISVALMPVRSAAQRTQNPSALNLKTMLTPYASNPTPENMTKLLNLFGNQQKAALKPNQAQADDDIKKKVCDTIHEIAVIAVSSFLFDDLTEEEAENVAGNFYEAAFDWTVRGCSLYA